MTHCLTEGRLSEQVGKMSPMRMSMKSTLSTLLILFLILLLTGVFSPAAQASGLHQPGLPEGFTLPQSFAYPWRDDGMYTSPNVGAATVKSLDHGAAPIELIIDSDFGVDDTAAIGLLLAFPDQAHIQALVTVAGVTEVDNAANNAQFILAQYGLTTEQIPVIVGSKKPWNVKLSSTSKLIHGPDGLWWLGALNPQLGSLPKTKAEKFYCGEADFSNTTLLLLGPATNIAKALQRCPQKFEEFNEIVVLGGAVAGGNTTPVAEFNFWQDPKAIQYLVDYAKPRSFGDPSRLNLTILPLDTFAQVGYSFEDILELGSVSGSVGQILTAPYGPFWLVSVPPGPIAYYAFAQAPDIAVNLNPRFLIPDAVAVAYVLQQSDTTYQIRNC